MSNIDTYTLLASKLLISMSDVDALFSIVTSALLLVLAVVSLFLKIKKAMKDGELSDEELDDITKSIEVIKNRGDNNVQQTTDRD